MATGKMIERRPVRATAPPASYLRLIRRFPLRPIQSEAELDRATAVMNELKRSNQIHFNRHSFLVRDMARLA